MISPLPLVLRPGGRGEGGNDDGDDSDDEEVVIGKSAFADTIELSTARGENELN